MTGSSYNTTMGAKRRARQVGFTSTVPAAVKAEKVRRLDPSAAESLLSDSDSDLEAEAEAKTEVDVLT